MKKNLISGKVKKPWLVAGKPFVKEEEWDRVGVPYSTFHLRIPVTARGSSVKEVKAEIIGGSKEVIPDGPRMLFWEREFPHHSSHDNVKTPKDVAEHMRNIHYQGTHPVNLNEGETKNVNLIVKIENYEKAQIPNLRGEERKLEGTYEIGVLITGKGVKAEKKRIVFSINKNNLKVIDFKISKNETQI